MLLAGDIGGTKTLLGLFDRAFPRPHPIASRVFSTLEYSDLTAMISVFATEAAVPRAIIEAASFGVAGPVLGDDRAADQRAASRRRSAACGDARHRAREPAERPAGDGVRGAGAARRRASRASGGRRARRRQHGAHRGRNGTGGSVTAFRRRPVHSVAVRGWPRGFRRADRAGHHGAARTRPAVQARLGRTRRIGPRPGQRAPRDPRRTVSRRAQTRTSRDAPAAITSAALEGRCSACVETLATFVEAYGAEAGNLALRTVATAGLFVGGGIAPKILPALADGTFMRCLPRQGTARRSDGPNPGQGDPPCRSRVCSVRRCTLRVKPEIGSI